MDRELLKQLSRITEEEKNILAGGRLDMSVYSDNMPSVVDSQKLLEAGLLLKCQNYFLLLLFLIQFQYLPLYLGYYNNYLNFDIQILMYSSYYTNKTFLVQNCLLLLKIL